MFKERQTFPRYTVVTYDVKYVLDYVKKCSASSKTTLELTSKILATMMRLLIGQRFSLFIHRLYVPQLIQDVSFTYQSY